MFHYLYNQLYKAVGNFSSGKILFLFLLELFLRIFTTFLCTFLLYLLSLSCRVKCIGYRKEYFTRIQECINNTKAVINMTTQCKNILCNKSSSTTTTILQHIITRDDKTDRTNDTVTARL